MSDNIRRRSAVATYALRGRIFNVICTEWTNSDGPSFDVSDAGTNFALHNESFDDLPTEEEVTDLISNLEENGIEQDPLFFDETELSAFLDSLSDDAPEGGLTSAEEMTFERQILRDGR